MTVFEGKQRVLEAQGNLQAGCKRIVKQDTFGG